MTSEQIAELRKTLRAEDMPVWGTTDGRVATWKTTPDVSKRVSSALNALPKLLDEREALLEAARHVVEAASAGTGPMTAGELRLRDAIAKAEAP